MKAGERDSVASEGCVDTLVGGPSDREAARLDLVRFRITVLVRDDRVVAIGPTATVMVPNNATLIDGRGRFLNRQSLAHVGNLTNLYFMPIPAHLFLAAITGLAILVVLVTPLISGPNRRLSAVVALVTLGVVGLVGLTLPGGPLSVVLVIRRSPACVATGVAAALFDGFWIPVLWRSSDSGIGRLATRLHDADISVQSTLIVK